MRSAVKILGLMIICLTGLAQSPRTALEFAASGDARAHDEFIVGTIALHNSAYADAAIHFRKAQSIDANFVMAYWGEAMTFNHPFWGEQDISGGRRALAKLAPTRTARAAKAATPREREYLNAVELLYGEGDKDARDFDFADAMKTVALRHPADYEAAAFYALAILSARRIGDGNYAQTQSTAAAILKAILDKYPDHPGGLHYLIHAYDDADHAALALDAAHRYETLALADSTFHAIHMPTHIYAQLGMWPDVARLNQAAFAASDRWVRANNFAAARRDYHSLDFLQYAQLQMGQYAEARETVALMLAASRQARIPAMDDQAAILSSRFAIEAGDWTAVAPFAPASRLPELVFARGLGALQAGDVASAKRMSVILAEVVQADLTARRRVHAAAEDLLNRLLMARIALSENRSGDAERLGLDAVQAENRIEAPAELSGIFKPATEFYGEILLALQKPGDAETQFRASLKQRPKRALSLLGLARARAMKKDTEGAAEAYRELAAIWINANPELPALKEVRSFLQFH